MDSTTFNITEDEVWKRRCPQPRRSGSQARLADLQAQVRTACADATAAHQEIMGLAAAGWPGNRSSIQDARAKLRAAETALKAALADAHALVAMLRAQRSPSPTPTG